MSSYQLPSFEDREPYVLYMPQEDIESVKAIDVRGVRFERTTQCKVTNYEFDHYGGDGYDAYIYELSCGHSLRLCEDVSMKCCPVCGARVVE